MIAVRNANKFATDVDREAIENVLAHDYFALDADVIWDSATRNALAISAQIKAILSVEFPDFQVLEDVNLWRS